MDRSIEKVFEKKLIVARAQVSDGNTRGVEKCVLQIGYQPVSIGLGAAKQRVAEGMLFFKEWWFRYKRP